MPVFQIMLHGKGCLIEWEYRDWLVFKRVKIQKVGFYTTRFIEAFSAHIAIESAIKSVLAELDTVNLSDKPPSIFIEEISELSINSETFNETNGFSWYLEQ